MAYQANKKAAPRNKWNSLRMANKIPEVELERKLTDIRRYHARNKRDQRIEETRLWDELYENEKALKDSIAKYRYKDVIDRLTLILKSPEEETPQSFSEYYRQFIIFKARTTARMFGEKAEHRPRYTELYAKERAPKKNNKKSIDRLFQKYNDALLEEQKTLGLLITEVTPEEEDVMALAHFPFEADEATSNFATRRLSRNDPNPYRRQSRQFRPSLTKDVIQSTMKSEEGSKPIRFEPVYKLPPISDRFRSKEDRMFIKKNLQDIEDTEDTEAEQNPNTLEHLPDLINGHPINRSNTNSSTSTEEY